MDYNHIKNYLDKFRNIIFSKEETLGIISNSILNNLKIEIPVKSIQIKSNIIYIKTSPIIRGEVLMKKDLILKDINSLVKDISFVDIK